MHEGGSAERPAIFFDDAEDFRAWLEANHESATELWMGLHKKHVEDRGLQWAEAVREALCFGWIDSMSQRIDDSDGCSVKDSWARLDLTLEDFARLVVGEWVWLDPSTALPEGAGAGAGARTWQRVMDADALTE